MKPLTLASQSPRRARILREAGLTFQVVKTHAIEVAYPHDPERTVRENAVLKLKACGCYPALAADTIVWCSNRIYGKPRDLEEAKVFLRELAARTHVVYTGVAYGSQDDFQVSCYQSHVTFKALTEEDITNYVNLVKPTDRAGAYDIADYGSLVVASYTGSFENIMGLPLTCLSDFHLI